MDRPLSGIKVVELAIWVAGPSTGAVLADWGADVIKIEEPQRGDPVRGMTIRSAHDPDVRIAWSYELDNRNKRSAAVNLRDPEGRAFALKLIEQADVFLTNLRLDALERLQLDYAHLAEVNPRLIYATLNGYGHRGPERLTPGFDYAAGWSRSGLMATVAEPGKPPPAQRPGMIDHAAGLAMAGAISTALFARERTGRGQEVRLSLFAMALWMNSVDLTHGLLGDRPPAPESRSKRPNPLWNSYRCKDDTWVYFVMVQSDRYWKDFCKALKRTAWLKDPRFKDHYARTVNNRALIKLIDEAIATRTRAQWAPIFDRHCFIWAPVQSVAEVIEDPQAEALGVFAPLDHPQIPNCRLVRSPVEFSEGEVGPRVPAPELGQHTEDIAQELGFDWERIGELKTKGALG
ncbi:MAG TPA: CoA transferase [Candidatus Binataceae bacterium]|nr:CoA transferase [Candidatus Binataceae bacterium]